ncbi:MAG: hypothetical protein PHD70_06010 [Anaerostipes sp.]|nr:hypothetical protein [Anaerostipes sp.]MDD3746013.1 hypothetical protein [Anaerostipes sp.]
MDRYVYKPSHFMRQMTVPGIFTALIGIVCLIQCFISEDKLIYILVLCLCLYNVWNMFVSISNPSEIIVDENHLIFSAYGRQHMYDMDLIKHYAMRPLAGNTRMYMTINKNGLLKGRYWVRTDEFSNNKQLQEFFYNLDAKVNPDSIVTRAREQGRQRLQK